MQHTFFVNFFCRFARLQRKTPRNFLVTRFMEERGTLSNYDDDGSENITKKMNLRPFKLYRVYLEPLNSSNVGDFSWSLILKGFIHVQIEKGKFVVACPRPL